MERQKVIIKVISDISGRIEWTHLCYTSREVYFSFLKKFNLKRSQIVLYISKWVMEDFGIELPMTNLSDVAVLRELVISRDKIAYPHICRESYGIGIVQQMEKR